MMNSMTSEQQSLMIRVLQFGFATGARNRFECLRSYLRAYPDHEQQAVSAAAAFERGCGMSMEQGLQLEAMSDKEFANWIFSGIPERAAS